MQVGRHVCHYSKLFHEVVIDYHTYDNELFVIVQVVKMWKNYLLGKELIIHKYSTPSMLAKLEHDATGKTLQVVDIVATNYLSSIRNEPKIS